MKKLMTKMRFFKWKNEEKNFIIIEYAQNENLLSTFDQKMLARHLNLFLQDKNVLSKFLTLNENRLVDVNDCLKAERFLESFELLLQRLRFRMLLQRL